MLDFSLNLNESFEKCDTEVDGPRKGSTTRRRNGERLFEAFRKKIIAGDDDRKTNLTRE